MIDISKYKCRKCGFKFTLRMPRPVVCPQCGNLYVDWINHEKILEQIRKSYPKDYEWMWEKRE